MEHRTWLDDALGSPLESVVALDDGVRAIRVPLAPWQQSLDDLVQLWATDGPFDAVAGFSQGGWLAVLLLAAAAQFPARYGCFASLRAAVVVAVPDRRVTVAAAPTDDDESAIVLRSDQQIAVPTVFLKGTRDPLLAPIDGVEYAPLTAFFSAPTAQTYAGAHQVPFDRKLWAELSARLGQN